MSEQGSKRFQLIVPEGLLVKVKRMAQNERRSVSNMIVVLVEEAIKTREKERGQLAASSAALVSYSHY